MSRLLKTWPVGPVAIIGAGLSGLSCAQVLHQAGVDVRLIERAARVGGRCATRLWQGHLVDHGVQYFTAQSSEFKRELLASLRQFRPIIPPILDQSKKVVFSVAGPRFYVLQGNNYFPQVLSRGLNIQLNCPVDTVTFHDDHIECLGERYRAVVSSLPAPQTNRLFSLGQASDDYVCCVSALLEYSDVEIPEARETYGRIFPEDTEPLKASYCENHKSSRIVGHNKTVFVVHAGPQFSLKFADRPADEYVPLLVQANDEVWKIPAGKCTATFGHRWRLSQPAEQERHPFTLPRGAFVCGDSCCAPIVEEVWLDGRRAAEEVLDYLDS